MNYLAFELDGNKRGKEQAETILSALLHFEILLSEHHPDKYRQDKESCWDLYDMPFFRNLTEKQIKNMRSDIKAAYYQVSQQIPGKG